MNRRCADCLRPYCICERIVPVRVTGTDVTAAAKALGLSDSTGLALVKIAHAIAEARR